MWERTINRLGFVVIVGFAGVLFSQTSEEKFDNPEYQMLKGVQAGTVTKIKMSGTKTDESGKTVKMEMTGTSTFVAVSAQKVDVHVEGTMTVDGKTEKDDEQLVIPAKISKAELPEKIESGQEELTVAGTKYKCTWEKYKRTADKQTIVTKYWLCKDLAFQLLKTEETIEVGGKVVSQLTVEVTGFDLPK